MTDLQVAVADPRAPAELLMELTFRSAPDRLKMVRAGIRAAAQTCGFDTRRTADIVLAVDEACANVIIHVYDRREDGDINLKIFRLRDGVRVTIRDFGPATPDLVFKIKDPDDITPGGLGTRFITEIMDEMNHSAAPDGNGNTLELIKKFAGSK